VRKFINTDVTHDAALDSCHELLRSIERAIKSDELRIN